MNGTLVSVEPVLNRAPLSDRTGRVELGQGTIALGKVGGMEKALKGHGTSCDLWEMESVPVSIVGPGLYPSPRRPTQTRLGSSFPLETFKFIFPLVPLWNSMLPSERPTAVSPAIEDDLTRQPSPMTPTYLLKKLPPITFSPSGFSPRMDHAE
ncbi:hypothetical protein M231_08067 [Tremella mesenterica]|uniref:Uncharacterized protein n=1 Tax=Tremella mesenterica TaxID=5217 RepID=A0A4Q1BF55_TREME|nr:hypothetical protein M231_08073 [Tremella mesenterica]RXK34677.1 hypothetical protein M231_08067 [Tremella mesenterica]